MTDKYAINITSVTTYVENQSDPANHRFVFAYTITIENVGELGAQLLNRHWIITDSAGKVQEVKGEGVIGEQPHLKPGESFQYTSASMLETAVGSMYGSYEMLADDGVRFDADIPAFSLSIPRTLH